ncbi:MAG: discoidin domain-containing protein, partial [Verrucomicrobiales bacterium]|nr:discoidin domain-containing protein [Verrucomicrobiales bacterium]
GLTYDGSGPKGETLEHLVYSDPKDDQHFRPICMANGPDGALYFCDWSQTIIGHLQHHIRDPQRDHQHGRIYRITYKGRPLADPPKISGQPVDQLLNLLGSPVNGTRLLAKIELDTHPTDAVIAAVDRQMKVLKLAAVANREHHKMELLWVHQWHNVVNQTLLEELLASPKHEARAAAGRVLCYWRDRVTSPIEKMRALCSDENPRVRLEGIRMASFYNGDEAIDAANAALLSRNHPSDYYLDYILKETMQQLETWWRPALVEGKIAADNPAGAAYLLSNVSNRELLAMPRIPAVLDAWLTRPGLPEVKRLEALLTLTEQSGTTSAEKLLQALESKVGENLDVASDLGRLLNRQPANELKPLRARLEKLSSSPKHAAARPAALATIMRIDGSIDDIWNPAQTDPAKLRDALEAIPWIADPTLRASAHDKVAAVLTQLPKSIDEQIGDTTGTTGRYVRVSLPRPGILTLAEVQVFSNGTNIAPTGKATQSSVASSGEPKRAIDGDTNGIYGAATSTHTKDPDNDPWWELDLGRSRSIDAVALWNRTGNNGSFVKRLDGFTLEVLDNTRRPVFTLKDNPAPPETVRIETGGDPRGAIQHAAINAIVSTQQKPAATFKQLCTLIGGGENISAASRGLRKISRDAWDTTAAGNTATALHTWAKTVPAEGRTAQDFIENVQVARELASYLPGERSTELRSALDGLGVNVTVVRTVHEQLRYDTTEITVQAGKPFEIVFENDDVMPHNL